MDAEARRFLSEIHRELVQIRKALTDDEAAACPGCGSTRLEPTPSMDHPRRVTCLACHKSYEGEAA